MTTDVNMVYNLIYCLTLLKDFYEIARWNRQFTKFIEVATWPIKRCYIA